jgi:Mn2+/Fe2+ NRAMP family transporter
VVAIVNGVATAPFLITVMLISSNEPIMGEYRNGHLATIVGWLTVAVMLAGTAAVLVTLGH